MVKDLEEYLVQLQKQYTDMNKSVEIANKQIKEGLITEESAKVLKDMVNTINNNYQRVLFCRYLVKLPPKFIQKLQKKKLDKEMQKAIKENADKDSVVKENQECLDKIKEEVNHE